MELPSNKVLAREGVFDVHERTVPGPVADALGVCTRSTVGAWS
ncbi:MULTISPECIES: hypothetical protein [unclassified Arthrobacter]|nr:MULTISPECIES: hypothetical protein [unclassified Arthrobacter]